MALSLTLDTALPVLAEPGFWRFVSSGDLARLGGPADATSAHGVWCDTPTKTLMLRPLQLDNSWLNTPQQLDSIVGLSDLVMDATDLSTGRVYESPAFGNNDNPWINHRSVGPSGAFPSAARGAVPGAFPGDGPSLVGIPASFSPVISSVVATQNPTVVMQPSLTAAATGSAAVAPITPIGTETSGKFVAQSAVKFPANRAFFFRYFQPSSQLGFPCIYQIYIGQFVLRFNADSVEVWQDVSSAGDRTAWQKVKTAYLWNGVADAVMDGPGLVTANIPPKEWLDHDRSLLFLPYRRNQILLYSSAGMWATLTVNASPRRLPDGSDWDITRSDSVAIWVMTPAQGRFQLQQVKYPAGTITMQSPPTTVDYTPTTPPAITLTDDADHGTTVSSIRSQPPSYTLPPDINDDQAPPTTLTGAQSRTYGVTISMTASSDHRWTPFFYGYQLETSRTFANPPTTPVTVSDVSAGHNNWIVGGTMTAGLDPGDGRLICEVIDKTPFDLGAYYYRVAVPVQLKDGSSKLFTGITEPTDVNVIHSDTNIPRHLKFSALDRWKALADTYLRDQRDWSGYGHIDVVNFLVQQAGIDTTSAEWPAGYTPAVPPTLANVTTLNTALDNPGFDVRRMKKEIKGGWRPTERDTAASFIKQIRDFFSGWNAGFRLDGTFFYLPREYFTTSSVTFTTQNGGVNPVFREPVTWTTKEPEANVIVVECGDAKDGSLRHSSTWVDWASIQNPAKVNYLGRWRAEIVQKGGVFTTPQLNRMARIIWNQTRRRRRQVSFEADFVPTLKIGQVFTLGSYGDYRLIGMNVSFDHQGVHFAHYEGEFLEAGF